MQGYTTDKGIIWNTTAWAQNIIRSVQRDWRFDYALRYALQVLVRLGEFSRMYSAESEVPSLLRLSTYAPLGLRIVCSTSHLAIKRSFNNYKGRNQGCSVRAFVGALQIELPNTACRSLASSYVHIALHPVEPVNLSFLRHQNRFRYHNR